MKELRAKIVDIAKRRGIYWGAYEIYSGVSGFYDYGPVGALLKKNILDYWLEEFVYKDGLLLIDSPAIGPDSVYKASGHADKFTDYMVRCNSCGHAFRVDELIAEYTDNPDALSPEEINEIIQKHEIRCPDCNGEFGPVEEFHLMFSTKIGLDKLGFLRPETAQGIFVNFPTLYRVNREKLPMGVAQIGRAYRNEISPRQGMLRQREFNMAEIELFFDPETEFNKELLGDIVLPLKTMDGAELKLRAKDAYNSGIANGYTLYYMGKILRFLERVGIDISRVRFRQHHREELAHYSRDTWDCEILLSYGWVEAIGISYRGDYDLSRHMKYSGVDMRAFRKFGKEKIVQINKIVPRMELLGPRFKAMAMKIARAMEDMELTEEVSGTLRVEIDGRIYEVPEEAYEVISIEKKVTGERFVPHVIEPSFGIDRIVYAILEHSFYEREDSGYKVLRFAPQIAPVKVGVFPLMSKDGLDTIAMDILKMLRISGINAYYDDSGSIGRRYARADEIGVPYCITVDYQTKEDSTVTIRHRDTTEQKRLSRDNLRDLLRKLVLEELKFEEL